MAHLRRVRVNPKKPIVPAAVRREIISHWAVRLETHLYAYAMKRCAMCRLEP